MKYIRATLGREVWEIPADVIAANIAKYRLQYEKDQSADMLQVLYDEAEGDDWEIKDWAQNNTNWEDIAEYAVLVKTLPSPSLGDLWLEAEIEIVSHG